MTELIVAGSLGVLLFILTLPAIALGEIFPFLNIIASFFGPMLVVSACLIIDKFGAAALVGFVYSLLVLPLPFFGSPGLFLKVITITLSGLLVDIIYSSLRKNKEIAVLFAGAVTNLAMIVLFYGLLIILGLPAEIGELAKRISLPILLALFGIVGAIGGWAGWKIYLRIQNTSIIKRIQQ